MPQKILQINFNYSMPHEKVRRGTEAMAEKVVTTPGLVWKIWIQSESKQVAGGLYLFESEDAARNYLDGPVIEKVRANPAFSHFRATLFDIMPEPSATTRAPVG